jgi:hypothetical protein
VTEVTALDLTQAFRFFIEACEEGSLAHIGQPELNAALAGAARRYIGDASAWDRKSSSVDISPLCAVTLAHWGVVTRPSRLPEAHSLAEVAERMWREGRGPRPPWASGPAHLNFPRRPDNWAGVSPSEIHIPQQQPPTP